MTRTWFALLGFALAPLALAQDFTLTILHTNDMHAHAEPTSLRVPDSDERREYGGYARLATLVRREKATSPNPVLLDGGDVFQGTLYFNVYEGLADLTYMNAVGYDAMAVGNHEFDKGPEPLLRFARHAGFPLLAANLDLSKLPELDAYINGSKVLLVGGESIGVVGACVEGLKEISSPGPDVTETPLVASIQREIDALRAQAVDKIVLLTHVGLSTDIRAVRNLRGVDVVVGGHSHTLLGDLTIPELMSSLRGDYPTIVQDAEGREVLVVQAWEWGKVLGKLEVTFDEDGEVSSWRALGPLPVTDQLPEDPTVAAALAAFRMPIEALASQVVGAAPEGLPRSAGGSRNNPIAHVIADAQLEKTRPLGAVAAFINAGGVRAPLDPGEATFGELIEIQPFNNTLVVMEVTGAELLAALRHGVERGGGFLYPSHTVSYEVSGGGVSNVTIEGRTLNTAATYKITVNAFTASGGDAHAVLAGAQGSRVDTGFLDIDALVEYFQSHSPILPPEPRVR